MLEGLMGVKYEDLFEEYESEENLEEVKNALEDEGYTFDQNVGLREPDLSEDPGIEIPYFGDLKKPGNIADGVGKIMEVLTPSETVSPYMKGIVVNGDNKMYATSEKDYRKLKEVTDEVLER